MADEAIPGFTVEPELEDLLDEHPLDLDEETRQRVQLYKSRKLQAKRDAGLSGEAPSWTVRYPGERAGRTSGNGETPAAPEPAVEEDRPEESPAESKTPPGRTETIEAPEEGDEALMEYYRSVKSGSGRPRRTDAESTRGDAAAGSPSNGPSPDVTPPAPAQADTAEVLALVKEWVNSLETRLEEYHEKIVALEEENAELRQELGRRRD